MNCQICNKEFHVIPARKETAKFCSRGCKAEYQHRNIKGENHPRWTGGTRIKQCAQCGKEFTPGQTEAISSFRARKFCSHSCGWIGQIYNAGADHPNWTGGKKKRGFRHDVWAQQVITRDKGICQKCGVTGVEMHAHHIKSFIDNEDLRYDLDNGTTLCSQGHWGLHSAPTENGVNSVELLPACGAGDNTEPSVGENLHEGVTTNGRAYRRWEGYCHWCGAFISKRQSQVKGKDHLFCGKSCMGKHRAAFTWNYNIAIPPTAVIPTRAPRPKGMI